MLRILHYFCHYILGLLLKNKIEKVVKLWNKAVAAYFEVRSKKEAWGTNKNHTERLQE